MPRTRADSVTPASPPFALRPGRRDDYHPRQQREFAIEHLGVPVANVIPTDDPDVFFCPGSLLRLEVDTEHPIGYGMPPGAAAMFVNNGAYAIADRPAPVTTVVHATRKVRCS